MCRHSETEPQKGVCFAEGHATKPEKKFTHKPCTKNSIHMPVLLLRTPASHFFQWFFPLATPQRPCFMWRMHTEAHISEHRMWNTHTHSSCLLISLKCCCHLSIHATPHGFLSASFIQSPTRVPPPQQQRNGGGGDASYVTTLLILVFLLCPNPVTFFVSPG